MSSLPPINVLISGGSSDSTTMPTSQNQLVTIAPHHSRASARRCRIIATVEVAILAETLSCGAPSPVGGINRPAVQQANANPITSKTKTLAVAAARGQTADDGAGENGDEGRAFDQRIAGRQLLAPQMVRQDAVFERAEQRGDHAETRQRDKQNRDRLTPIAAAPPDAATKISANFRSCATRALS